MRGALGGLILAICIAIVIAFALMNFHLWRDCKDSGGAYVQGVSLTGYVCIK